MQFAEMSGVLKNAPRLAAVIQQRQGSGAYLTFDALAGLALLIWVVPNRTHIIAPEATIETRRVAATVRNTEP
ncbi:hypothetical protein [Sphingorhabdus sp.]|uniref:hypothetical protein n=1 Tax=Sphingorhabdus sp. TaxID=1902408 RepID=UPI0037C652AA